MILARSPLRRGPVRLSGHETPLSAVAFAGRSIRRKARNVRNWCGDLSASHQPCQPVDGVRISRAVRGVYKGQKSKMQECRCRAWKLGVWRPSADRIPFDWQLPHGGMRGRPPGALRRHQRCRRGVRGAREASGEGVEARQRLRVSFTQFCPPRCSKIGAGVCIDRRHGGRLSPPGLPPPVGAARGSRHWRRGRSRRAPHRGGRVLAGGRGRRAARCRSGGIAHPGGWTMDHRSIGADCETRRSARRRQLRRRRGESRPARGAVRPGDGPGERVGVNPARSTHAGPWFQRRRGSGTTGKRRGRQSCGQAGRPSRPPRGRRQRGIEAPTRRGLRGHRNWGVAIEDILR